MPDAHLAQADALSAGKYALAGLLPVDGVRTIRPEPDHVGILNLDVQWEPAQQIGPGARGHAGITGLRQERTSDGTSLKNHRKSLYAKLSRLANEAGVRPVR